MDKNSKNHVLRRALISLVIVVVFVVSATPSKAAGWDYDLFVYLWALGMDGTMTVRGQESDVDVPFSDIFDNLDLAFSTHLEARQRGRQLGLVLRCLLGGPGQGLRQGCG